MRARVRCSRPISRFRMICQGSLMPVPRRGSSFLPIAGSAPGTSVPFSIGATEIRRPELAWIVLYGWNRDKEAILELLLHLSPVSLDSVVWTGSSHSYRENLPCLTIKPNLTFGLVMSDGGSEHHCESFTAMSSSLDTVWVRRRSSVGMRAQTPHHRGNPPQHRLLTR